MLLVVEDSNIKEGTEEMENRKDSWEIYKKNFMKRDVSIGEIKEYLSTEYGIELAEYEIDEIKPYSRWKSKLDSQIKDLKNIVYIKCYEKNMDGKPRPLICGITKTGIYGTTDFNFNINANKDFQIDKISGRGFMKDNGFKYNRTIYLFECKDKNEALLLERDIQHKFNLFGS